MSLLFDWLPLSVGAACRWHRPVPPLSLSAHLPPWRIPVVSPELLGAVLVELNQLGIDFSAGWLPRQVGSRALGTHLSDLAVTYGDGLPAKYLASGWEKWCGYISADSSRSLRAIHKFSAGFGSCFLAPDMAAVVSRLHFPPGHYWRLNAPAEF